MSKQLENKTPVVEEQVEIKETPEAPVKTSKFSIDPNLTLREDNSPADVEAWNRLIRVKIVCNDPNKNTRQGETWCAGNSQVTARKYVLFNKPYHVEKILLDAYKDKKCIRYKKESKGDEYGASKLLDVPEEVSAYTIEYLDPIPSNELEKIKKRQSISTELED